MQFRKILACFGIFITLFASGSSFVSARTPLPPSPTPAVTAGYSEGALSFASVIEVKPSTDLEITETIQYFTEIPKHGIYRYIPYRYNKQGLAYQSKVEVISITDELLKAQPFTESHANGNVVLKIGDKDVTFTGTKTYVIAYRVKNAVQFIDGRAELLWDITGEGWQFPILSSTAQITWPTSLLTDSTQECFSGPMGSNDQRCVITVAKDAGGRTALVSYAEKIEYGDNVTVKISAPASGFVFPTGWAAWWQSQGANLLLILLVLPTVIAIALWLRIGRDEMFVQYNIFDHGPRPTRTKPVFFQSHTPYVYEPLQLTPSQVGSVLDERVDTQDVVAEIVELAHQKLLTIKQVQEKTWFKEADYTFQRTKKNVTLPAHQRYLLDALCPGEEPVNLSALKGSFASKFETFKKKVDETLTSQKIYGMSPLAARGIGFGVGSVALVVAVGLAFVLEANYFYESPLPFVLVAIQIPVVLLCAWNCVRRTAKGYNYFLQARGLQQMLKYGKWREEIKEKHLFLDEVLPFAIALGVVDRLAKDMADLKLEPPRYMSSVATNALLWSSFTSDFTKTTANSLSYNPSSSSWSGGGSSGGGGGGGGGGSW